MATNKKSNKQTRPKKKTSKRKGKHKMSSQTEQPFEQDPKRRIGHFGGTGEPPIIK